MISFNIFSLSADQNCADFSRETGGRLAKWRFIQRNWKHRQRSEGGEWRRREGGQNGRRFQWEAGEGWGAAPSSSSGRRASPQIISETDERRIEERRARLHQFVICLIVILIDIGFCIHSLLCDTVILKILWYWWYFGLLSWYWWYFVLFHVIFPYIFGYLFQKINMMCVSLNLIIIQ